VPGSFRLAAYRLETVPEAVAIAAAIVGVGVVRRARAVRWRMAQRIGWAWILTIPCSAAVGWLAFRILAFVGAAR